jgi:DNA-binding FadR family transcriptional regulator
MLSGDGRRSGALTSDTDLGLRKLDRQPAAERIADQLMAVIVDRKLEAGALLPSEQQLSEMFGVSRPVIREALRHLAALRIIDLAPGRRPRVRPLTSDLLRTFFDWALSLNQASLLALHELRRGVEGESATLAAQRRSEEDVDRLRKLLEKMRASLEDEDQYTELDVEFHLAIAAAARNPLLVHLSASIRAPMERTIRRGLRLASGDTNELEILQQDHERIADAIADRDPARARAAMDQHFDRAVARFVAAGIESP